jgi:hypothetical protein
MAESNDLPAPPPGGYLRDPGPAGPEEAQQAALERIADALEGLLAELAEIKSILAEQGGTKR